MDYEEIKRNAVVRTYIAKADDTLAALGYTEHSFAHVTVVAENTGYILKTLGYPDRTVELGRIAGLIHDIGNLVNRFDHAQTGALMAFRLLDSLGFPPEEIADIVTAIGNHDEGTGVPVSPISAALILADKADVRRNRVRNPEATSFDIHDRVNYSVTGTELKINPQKTKIRLKLTIDTKYSSISEYFEIFLHRMLMSKKAAEALGLEYKLTINDHPLM